MIKPKLEIDTLIQTLKVHYKELIKDAKMSYAASDITSAQTKVTVESDEGFDVKQVVIAGEPDNEETELILTKATDAVTDKEITMASNFVFDHPQGTPIYIIPFNQVELYRTATATAPTLGTDTPLATIDIQPDSDFTIYRDTTNSTGYGWIRFKDSVNTLYSPLSDAAPYAGYADNTVFSIKDRALISGGWKKNDIITDDFLNKWLWEGRRDLFNKLKRWSFRKNINTDLGALTEGDYRIAVPTDLLDPETNKNVERVSIGDYSQMTPVSKKQIDEAFIGIAQTTVGTTVSIGAVTAVLTDIGDLDDSGTIQLGTIEITYTGRTIATNTLTGVPLSGSITAFADYSGTVAGAVLVTCATHGLEDDDEITIAGTTSYNGDFSIIKVNANTFYILDTWVADDATGNWYEEGGVSAEQAAGVNVYQGASLGLPDKYCVQDSYIYFNRVVHDDYADMNVWIDYFHTLTAYDSDSDILEEPDYDMFVNYLAHRIKKRLTKGYITTDDDDFQQWMLRSNNLIVKETNDLGLQFVPDIEHLEEF